MKASKIDAIFTVDLTLRVIQLVGIEFKKRFDNFNHWTSSLSEIEDQKKSYAKDQLVFAFQTWNSIFKWTDTRCYLKKIR